MIKFKDLSLYLQASILFANLFCLWLLFVFVMSAIELLRGGV